MGEATRKALVGSRQSIALDTFGGRIHVEWDPSAAVTPLGQLPFFIEFLKVSGVFDAWVADCPLAYHSTHASDKRAVLATLLLSILAGHHRYAHITAIRHGGIHPELLGVSKLVSEDAARRALARIDEASGVAWLDRHLAATTQPLLATPWILDLEATVKCRYGRQEGAVVGYNPKKPGRPSHNSHSAWMANTRLALAVDVLPGNETAPLHRMPGIWAWLDALPNVERPALLRGDIVYGSESVLREAEARDQPYLTKLRLTKNVKTLIKTWFRSNAWEEAGQGWEGGTDRLTLSGWSRARRVVVLRRMLTGEILMTAKDDEQERFDFMESDVPTTRDEYAVLVTSTSYEILALAQLYRDRADAENNFDELKNQWGWGGFTTQDLARCRLMARMVALVDNWWTLFVRLAQPHKHVEAISSRPLLLHGVATHTPHAGHTRLTITSLHAKQSAIQAVLTHVAGFLRTLKATAEQWTDAERLRAILTRAFAKFMLTTAGPPALPTSGAAAS
ncbi:MAG: transposase [Nitrospirota bacterium]|nr:transposase [Nitrospirota bacterium]